jgi:hypothetical protein
MADERVVQKGLSVAQNTGNPVLDSAVNILCGAGSCNIPQLEKLHEALLKLAVKEPGGLVRPITAPDH